MKSTLGVPALFDLVDEGCEQCPALCVSRTRIVIGSGNARDGGVVCVGSMPGRAEDNGAACLSGEAGAALLRVWARAIPDTDPAHPIKKSREVEALTHNYLLNPETGLVFWTNAAHCTTPDGRAPSATEVKNCRQRVHRIIYALDPKLILAFGSSACLSVLGQTVDTTRKSGTIMAASVPSPVDPKNVLSYPMLACPDIGAMARAGDDRLIRNKQGMAYQMLETLRFAYRILENTP